MLKQSHISIHALPSILPQNSVEALERLRDSYKGLPRETLTEADQVVLAAMEITLKQFKRGQHPA